MNYKRVVLKLSGESLRADSGGDNITPEILEGIVEQIKECHKYGFQIAIVVGGGNFWRGESAHNRGMERTTADNIGMLATLMNSLALSSKLEDSGVPCRVMSAIDMKGVAETFVRFRAIRHLEKKRVVIFGAGTGNPYFSTDTAAALRANEINADVMLKGTKVDGIYNSDPEKNSNSKMYSSITYDDALSNNIKVLDSTAFSLCKENSMKIRVFNMKKDGNITKAVKGENIGTLVSSDLKTTFKV